jgi:hypothetical protein
MFERLSEFCSAAAELVIFAPYVKLQPLKELLGTSKSCRILVVRWEAKDLIMGSSDLEVYDYCQGAGISLYRNPRLHLKAFIDSYRKCILGSANISARALNIPTSDTFNYELATSVDPMSFDDRLYLTNVITESQLITPGIYEQIKEVVRDKKFEVPTDDFKIDKSSDQKDFLISSLPMSYDVGMFLEVCNKRYAADEADLSCAIHDASLYKIDLDQGSTAQREQLKIAFFAHPFIRAFLSNLEVEGCIFFGSAKAWIHNNCADVPTPRRWEITQNIQILYRWFVDLGEGKFEIDIPGSHSERLRIVSR